MPAPRQHPIDGIADEIMSWLDTEPDWYANELIGEYRAPFAAQISEVDKLAAYRRMFYKQDADGNIQYDKPNNEGRQALWQRTTPDKYVQIAKAVGPKGGIDHMQSLEDDESIERPQSASEEYQEPGGY